MTAAEFFRELVFPLTQATVLIAMVFFWLLISLALYAGIFGVFLLIVSMPAYCRYLMAILEDRIHGRLPEPPTAEMFSLVDSLWNLFPLVPVAALVWIETVIGARVGADAGSADRLLALLPPLVFGLLVPASFTILAMTRSPIASLNPVSIFKVMRRSSPGFLLIPLAVISVSVVLAGLQQAGTPPFLLNLVRSFQLFLFCSLTGAVMHGYALHLDVDIPDAAGPDSDALDSLRLGERQAVANHAYGFISRGNRAGGLKHVQDHIDRESDVDGAYQWFFDEMMHWEASDAALYFAQPYLSRLLRMDQEAMAVKVLLRCLHRNAQFVPLEQDRALLQQVLEKNRREDLLAILARSRSPS